MNIHKIAIIGYGRFGKTLAEILPTVFPQAEIEIVKRDLTKVRGADIIIPAVPIREFEHVVRSLAPHLSESQLVMDVCSVKLYPKQIMQNYLPTNVQILATHPMFGPGTLAKTKGSLKGLKIVVDAVRIQSALRETIIKAFTAHGIEAITMSSDDHDKNAAQFHFSSQCMASVLKELSIEKTNIDTVSVSVLHDFVEFVQTDSIALLQDMYRYNPYCKEQLNKIQSAVEHVSDSIQL